MLEQLYGFIRLPICSIRNGELMLEVKPIEMVIGQHFSAPPESILEDFNRFSTPPLPDVRLPSDKFKLYYCFMPFAESTLQPQAHTLNKRAKRAIHCPCHH